MAFAQAELSTQTLSHYAGPLSHYAPEERWCDTQDDGGALPLRVAVVAEVTHGVRVRCDDAAGARGGHTKVVHRLRAQELTDGAPQHSAPIGVASVAM